ncbi:MAG: hypothetical protein ACRBK7_10445 [Acidimicrobiales bacterium]
MDNNTTDTDPAALEPAVQPKEANQLHRLCVSGLAILAIVLLALAGGSDTAVITVGSIAGINCGLSIPRNPRR